MRRDAAGTEGRSHDAGAPLARTGFVADYLPPDEKTSELLEKIDDLLRQQADLRKQIAEAQDRALHSQPRVDRRQKDRRAGEERRRNLPV